MDDEEVTLMLEESWYWSTIEDMIVESSIVELDDELKKLLGGKE